MDQFIQCICHNNLKVLVVEGEANAEQIAEAWTNLFYNYCDESEANETLYRTKLVSEITLLKQRNYVVMDWVKILRLQYFERLCNALKIMGYEYELNPNNPEQYNADLLRITHEINFSKLQVKVKEDEYQSILENQSKKDSVDEKYFSTIFFRINNYAKREAVNGQTTVQNYCAALRDFVNANKVEIN
jgi:hypothetical protein